MFKKEKLAMENMETWLGAGSVFKGTIQSSGRVRIDGSLDGGIMQAGAVTVGRSAQVSGDIVCSSIIVGGKVLGNITVTGSLELLSSAQVKGDIKAATVSIAKGAIFEGSCSMSLGTEKNQVITVDWANSK